LHGHETDYTNDLLDWTASQLSWVSQRAKGPIQDELYKVLRPILDQYDTQALEAFASRNGRGRTYQMLKALKAANPEGFIMAAGGQSQPAVAASANTPPASEASAKQDRGTTLFARGLFHLKRSGLRETLRMTGRYLSSGIGIAQNRRGPHASSANRVTNEDLLAALVILQSDLRNLRAEVAKLNRSSKD